MSSNLLWIISGESSGDAYGAALATAVRNQNPAVRIRGMGGELMRAAGVETFVDSTELGIIGIWEALKHLFFFLKLLRRMTKLAAEERPDTVVLIDYPGFNLPLAKNLHNLGIRVVWYVSPQVWAWKRKRIWKLARYCDRMLCIFPFEPECYAPTTLRAEFVGHPLLKILQPYQELGIKREKNLVLLLPGSRKMELTRLLPTFLQAARQLHKAHPELRFECSLPRQATLDFAKEIAAREGHQKGDPKITWSCGKTRERMLAATAAIAASGTVTVEAALLGLPVVVAYRLNWFSWWIAKRLVDLPSITIANLVCGKTVFQEFLQPDCTPENLTTALEAILPGGFHRDTCLAGLQEFSQSLGAAGDVSQNVAKIALENLPPPPPTATTTSTTQADAADTATAADGNAKQA